MIKINKRLDDLEHATGGTQERLPYICVADESELEELDLDYPIKVYLIVSPEDWD